MKCRKIVLIAVDLLLLLVFIVQCSASKKDSAKVFTFSDEVTEITIKSSNEIISVIKEGENWFVGDKKYPANHSSVESLVTALKEIRALDNVGKITKSGLSDRYELIDSKAILVEAKSGDKVVRKIKLGKNSETGVQGYAVLDDKNDIYLISGNLRNTFTKSVEDLRSKIVIGLEKSSIKSAHIENLDGVDWSLSRVASNGETAWTISGLDITVDSQKATSWLESLASLTTPKWYSEEDAKSLNGKKELSVKLESDNSVISLEIFKIPGNEDDPNSTDKYYGKATSTPYIFEIAGYSVQKYLKNPEELAE